jgi:transcriptional regulator with XRE-family HTH domain
MELSLFNDPEFRHGFVNSYQDSKLSAQIAAMRKGATLTQKQLGERLGVQQSWISALESGDYSQWSLPTLRSLAQAFDVALSVRFTTFSEVIARIDADSAEDFDVAPGYVAPGTDASNSFPDETAEIQGTELTVTTAESVANAGSVDLNAAWSQYLVTRLVPTDVGEITILGADGAPAPTPRAANEALALAA